MRAAGSQHEEAAAGSATTTISSPLASLLPTPRPLGLLAMFILGASTLGATFWFELSFLCWARRAWRGPVVKIGKALPTSRPGFDLISGLLYSFLMGYVGNGRVRRISAGAVSEERSDASHAYEKLKENPESERAM
jgi:hypothetical protein